MILLVPAGYSWDSYRTEFCYNIGVTQLAEAYKEVVPNKPVPHL